MFESVVETAKKFVHQWQLHQFSKRAVKPSSKVDDKSLAPKSSRFRVHGWRWHHLGIVRDLKRLQAQGELRCHALCDSGDTSRSRALREDMRAALQYILNNNWRLHNTVEQRLFVPWVKQGASGLRARNENRALRRDIAVIETERMRLTGDAHALAIAVDRWVGDIDEEGTPETITLPTTSTISPPRPGRSSRQTNSNACRRDLNTILRRIDRLTRSAQLLFDSSEAVLIPHVKAAFSEADQLRFNHQVIRNISAEDARISLVIFRDAIDRTPPVIASRADWSDFHTSVPIAIRKFALPYWRSKFVESRTTFLSGPKP